MAGVGQTGAFVRRVLIVFVGGLALGLAAFAVTEGNGPRPGIDTAAEPTSTTVGATSTSTTTTTPTTTTSTTTTTTLPPREALVIHGVGDVATDTSYIPALAQHGHDHAWSGLEGLFEEDDLTVINLECAPSNLGRPLPKTFVFRCDLESLPVMVANGVEVVNLANNHSGDYGKEALVDGRAQAEAAGLFPVGVGRDAAEAHQPAIIEVKGWTIAVLGFGGVVPSWDWIATDDRPGMADGKNIETMVAAIAAAAEIADLVIVTIHWGVELDTQPRPEQRTMAAAMIEAGADIIFGHHSHRLQPLEVVDGAHVAWGLGNFVWPRLSDASATTAIARVVVQPDGAMESCLIPAFIRTSGRPEITADPDC